MKTILRNRSTPVLNIILILIAGLTSMEMLAAEVFSWTDKNGVVHYTDTPPDGQVAQTIDIHEPPRPDASDVYPLPVASDVSSVDTSEDGVPEQAPEPLTPAQEKRKKMDEQREKYRKEQAEASASCEKHRQRLAQMEPSRRVFYTDEAGETVRMDDEQRVGLVEESREFISKNCK